MQKYAFIWACFIESEIREKLLAYLTKIYEALHYFLSVKTFKFGRN